MAPSLKEVNYGRMWNKEKQGLNVVLPLMAACKAIPVSDARLLEDVTMQTTTIISPSRADTTQGSFENFAASTPNDR